MITGFVLTIAVLCINMYFAITYIGEIPIHNWALYTFIGFVFFMYLAFISYLVSKVNFDACQLNTIVPGQNIHIFTVVYVA